MRRLLELLFIGAVACGGRIDDGTDASVDAGGSDSKSDVIMKPDTAPPPPTCAPDTFPCTVNSDCCSNSCFKGTCGVPPPPPPPCKPDGVACASDVECCSNVCNGTCGVQIGCATSSNKKCDICVAQSCCKAMVACNADAACSTWLACVQNCEQQGQSAFACSQPQSTCGPPSGNAESLLYKCAQTSCGNQCTVD